MICRRICIRYKAYKPIDSSRYANGQKHCRLCNLFIQWDGLWCPCCGYRLRTRPRHSKYRAKLREQKQIDQVNKTEKINTLVTRWR